MSHGSCACGAVKYSFEGEPLQQSICHCLPCREITGSVFTTNISIPLPSLNLLQGKESVNAFSLKHPAGMKLTYDFCESCGTKIYKEGDGTGVAIVQAGTLDHTAGEEGLGIEDVKIGAELWIKNRVGWLEEKKSVWQYQEFPGG